MPIVGALEIFTVTVPDAEPVDVGVVPVVVVVVAPTLAVTTASCVVVRSTSRCRWRQ